MYDESRFSWDALFPALSGSYHVFAIDTPRHGGSRPWSGYLDRARLMEIFAETFTRLGLARFSIAGLSMGGGLALEYAALHPEQVAAMALFEPGGIGERVDYQWLTWCYLKIPGMLRMLSRSYRKLSDAKLEKILRSIYTKGTAPNDPARLTAILRDEVQGKFSFGEQDMDDWQISGIGLRRLKWKSAGAGQRGSLPDALAARCVQHAGQAGRDGARGAARPLAGRKVNADGDCTGGAYAPAGAAGAGQCRRASVF